MGRPTGGVGAVVSCCGAVGRAVISEDAGKSNRSRFYLYCRQQGLWPREVAGHDPDAEPRAFDPFCPLRNVTAAYPPTLLIHGTKDTDVPYEQSELMDRELTRKGVEHELITVPGGSHGLGGTDPAVLASVSRVGDLLLGKGVVVAKDTPNFIGNHIGLYGVAVTLQALVSGRYSIEEIDAITGPAIGRPGSATFRTMDIAGVDVLAHVMRNLHERLPLESDRATFVTPPFVDRMIALGARTANKPGD